MLAGGKEAWKRSLNAAGLAGRGIGLGAKNGNAGAPKSNTVALGASPTRVPSRRVGWLSSIAPGDTASPNGSDDVEALGTNRPPLPNGPDACEPMGKGPKTL